MKFPMENVQMECQNEKVEKVKKKRKKVFYIFYKNIYQYVKIPRKHGVIFFYKKAKISHFYESYEYCFPIFCRIYAHVYFYNYITKNYKKNMFGKIYSHLVILNLEQYFIINYLLAYIHSYTKLIFTSCMI